MRDTMAGVQIGCMHSKSRPRADAWHFPHLNQNRSRGTIWYHVFEQKNFLNPQKARGFSGAKGGREGKLAAEGLQSLGAITISGFLHQKCRG